MSLIHLYTESFYEQLRRGSRRSAQAIVPLVMALVCPQKIVDVGCGTGEWLAVFKEYGVQDCLGIDADTVEPHLLQIPLTDLWIYDLEQPIVCDRTFDLVVSLEVAEHLPPECAETFVQSLTQLGAVILFSAAIPHQGGTHHVNEQWQTYWVERFQQRGYQAIDCLRKQVWSNDTVEPWYAQNMLLFVREDCLDCYPALQAELKQTYPNALTTVHPKIYLKHVNASATETQKRTPSRQSVVSTDMGTELRLNENRFGSLEMEITAVQFLDQRRNAIATLLSGDSLWIAIDYVAPLAIEAPIFNVTLLRDDDLVCYDTNTQSAGITLSTIEGTGKIELCLSRLDLNTGRYYVDVGVYEKDWTYAYDYHWRVYPLNVQAQHQQSGVLSLPCQWQTSTLLRDEAQNSRS